MQIILLFAVIFEIMPCPMMCGLKAAGIPFQLELKLWCHHDGQRAHLTLIQGSSIYHIYHWLISLGEFFQWWQGHQRLADGENSWPAYHGMRHPSGIRPCTGTCNPDCDSGRVFRPRHKLGWCKRNKLFLSVGRCRSMGQSMGHWEFSKCFQCGLAS